MFVLEEGAYLDKVSDPPYSGTTPDQQLQKGLPSHSSVTESDVT